MVFCKTLNTTVLEKIALLLRDQYSNVTMTDLLKMPIKSKLYQSIAENMPLKKYRFPSVIFRLIHRNEDFFKKVINKPVSLDSVKVCNNLISKMLTFLRETDRQQSEMNVSYRSPNCLYGQLCLYLNKQNCLKNRNQL